MGLNAYYFSARSYQYIENLAEQVFTLVIWILPVGRVWWMFFENFIIDRSYMTVLFHFLKSWIHKHKKDEIVIVITTHCIFRNAVQLKPIGLLVQALKKQLWAWNKLFRIFNKIYWKLADSHYVMNEEQWMCWITVSWSHGFPWSISWNMEFNSFVSEEVGSTQ